MTPDFINGLFEGIGSLMIWHNVQILLRDKHVRGVSPWPVVFFTGWGFWNLYYYPSLGQWVSFGGGVMIMVANLFWLALAWRYRRG